MARGSNQAKSGANAALGENQQLFNQGQSLYGGLEPSLMSTFAAPQGINPTDLAKMRTSNMQAAGGTQGAATGQGALLAGRTRNAGAGAAAIGEGARAAGEQLSGANLKTDLANQQLKEKQREGAQSGLESLYGVNMGTSAKDLGELAANVGADTQAKSQSWDWAKYILDPILSNMKSPTVGGFGMGG
jgi:hypothetical protein